ncbi:MAG: hypothetical protein DRI77_15320, partial [Chloroflexi bacterium]
GVIGGTSLAASQSFIVGVNSSCLTVLLTVILLPLFTWNYFRMPQLVAVASLPESTAQTASCPAKNANKLARPQNAH